MIQLKRSSAIFGLACCSLALLLAMLTTLAPVNAQDNSGAPSSTITATQTVATHTLPTLSAATAITATTANSATKETQPAPALGYLAFADGALASAGDFHLHITGLPATPAGGQYILWLLSAVTDTKALTAFTTVADQVDLTGATNLNLPLLFHEARITLEPLPAGDATTNVPTTMSERVVLQAQPAATTLTRLRPLLRLYSDDTQSDANASVTGENTNDATAVGALSAAQTQVDIAVQHTGFLRNALSTEDIPQARRHAEHIINILDGKNGFMYGDLDRNGLPENPGDGIGIRPYLAAVKAALPDTADLFSTAEDDGESLDDLLATVDVAQTHITDMFDKALQIFAADTVTEANRFAGELTALVDALNANVDAVHNRTVELVTYPFYGPPQSVSLPAIAVTSTVTSTLTATRTGSIEPTGGATATATPTATTAVAVTRTVRLQPTATPRATTVRGLTRRATATRASTPISTPAPTTTPVPTATPQPTPLPPLPTIQSSALDAPSPGTAWRNPVDGAIYLYIPGGRFEMGAEGADAASPKEEPRHAVTVESFWLQQTETTNAQYGRCVDEGACSAPANDRWDDPAFADHPVSNVSWQQAATYAAWAGGRLPTEAEWERSCRSDDGRIYPWGNDDASDQLANYNNAIGDTAPVGSYPAGQSAYGVLDLSGNLWEWTSSVEADYPYDATDGREDTATSAGNRAVRGGSFYYTNYQIRCAARTGFPRYRQRAYRLPHCLNGTDYRGTQPG
ncbi:MAG: SUMF1/EgtB/PvdO family nonheme iron enzyme [Caldilineaceae bacterium]